MQMDKKLYKLMDWAAIEGIIYSDEPHPEKLLGCHAVKGNHTLVQCFFENASEVKLVIEDEAKPKTVSMEQADEEGFFAVLLPGAAPHKYSYQVKFQGEKKACSFEDPYAYDFTFHAKLLKEFKGGTLINAQEEFGAHEIEMNGKKGTMFMVYAPNAKGVSLALKSRNYQSRSLPMILDEESGVYGLFMPGVNPEEGYYYSLRRNDGCVVKKLDPFSGVAIEKDGLVVSKSFGASKGKYQIQKTEPEKPFLLYTFDGRTQIDDVVDVEKKAKEIAELGFTHVSLGNLLPEKLADGVHVPRAFFASCADEKVQKFVAALHKHKLKVIGVLALSCFDYDEEFLASYDGTCIYEHLEERRGRHYKFGCGLFNYGRGEVKSYLMSAAYAYIDAFSLDGIRLADTSFMLYLDYGKNPGEWAANLYGGNENLEAIEFIKLLNKNLKKRYPNLLIMTDEFSGWQNLTSPLKDDGFGFDLKWNYAYVRELLKYMSIDPISRCAHHHELTMSYLYQEIEKFVLSITDDAMLKCGTDMDRLFPSDDGSTLRMLYAYTMVHPGAKGFMENLVKRLDPSFVKETNALYLEQGALNALDGKDAGFEWINSISANECVLTFLRKSAKKEETLLVCVNMAGCDWDNYKIGVPMDGKYKQIYVSENQKYGGEASVKSAPIKCKEDECDMRKFSIRTKLPAMSVSVYEYVPYTEKELADMKAKLEAKLQKEKEALRKKELLKKEKEKIRKSMKEKLALEFAKAEEAIARGAEFKKK